MGGEFVLGRRDHRQREAAQVDRHDHALGRFVDGGIDQQRILPARQIDVDVGQQLRIELGAMEGAVGTVDAEAVAQGIERIALAR